MNRGDGYAILDAGQREAFAEIVEGSLRVHRLSHFFLWAQGELRRLIPHEIVICGMSQDSGGGLRYRRFASTRYFREEHFDAVCRPGDGLMARLVTRWCATGSPYLLGPGLVPPGDAPLLAQADENELRGVAAHGVRTPDGRVNGFFCFSRLDVELDDRLTLALQVLTPHLHATLAQALIGEGRASGHVARTKSALTTREIEILRWVRDGKTNSDVAIILDVSPYTVKNHMQKILKKMEVENRSHAVSRAISLGILSPAGM